MPEWVLFGLEFLDKNFLTKTSSAGTCRLVGCFNLRTTCGLDRHYRVKSSHYSINCSLVPKLSDQVKQQNIETKNFRKQRKSEEIISGWKVMCSRGLCEVQALQLQQLYRMTVTVRNPIEENTRISKFEMLKTSF